MATSLRRVSNVIQRTAVDPRPWCAVVVGKYSFCSCSSPAKLLTLLVKVNFSRLFIFAMNLLITGAMGQLGYELQVLAAQYPQHHFVFTDIQGTHEASSTIYALDITDKAALAQMVAQHNIEVIINCAAFTNVDAAETQEELADLLNHKAVDNMAQIAQQSGAWLLHISTDYVFGAEPYNTPCREDQTGTPTGIYGRTKLQGEQAIVASGCQHIIVRTAWLYSIHGKNFPKTIFSLLDTRPEIKVVFDQVGTPTAAKDLAAALMHIIDKGGLQPENAGVYHYSNEGACSWYDFAMALCRLRPESACKVLPCHSNEFPSPVQRPAYSVLDKSKIKATFGLEIPHWLDSLHQVFGA